MVTSNNLSSVPISIGDTTSKNPPVGSGTSQCGLNREIPEELKLYVPENFDIDELLRKYPPDFDYKKKEYFIYLVHLVINTPTKQKKELLEEEYYVYLNSRLLERKCKNYNHCLKWLVDVGVLETDNWYIKGEKSKGYCFTKEYQTLPKPVAIRQRTLIKAILKKHDVGGTPKYIDKTIDDYPYLKKWYNKGLTIDGEKAREYIENLRRIEYTALYSDREIIKKAKKYKKKLSDYIPTIVEKRYVSRLLVVEKIESGNYTPSIDTSAGRLHSPLTQLKSELRQFLSYNGKKLIAIDVKNSQPYLSTILLNEEKISEHGVLNLVGLYNNNYSNPDNIYSIMFAVFVNNNKTSEKTRIFKDLVASGQFYEQFAQLLLDNGVIEDNGAEENRKKAKEIMFTSMFVANNQAMHIEAVKIFKKTFPEVYDVFYQIKKSKGEHRALALVLQNLEAQFVLERACRIISEFNPNVPLFTVHDSIVTTPEYVPIIRLVLKNVLTEAVGIKPTLKTEEW